ncbi:MAG: mucoidy inhibitor MuiA family protein, partial [Rhodospirillales bacterium]|nr:mucoidy inhibitor MuiA family protein [Rhodospirillales bacterium]
MAMRVGILGLLLTLIVQPAASHAAEVAQAESRITAVTVFPDRAEVTRAVEAVLPAGESTVAIAGLPASLLTETVRVRGVAEGRFQIGSVETRQVFAEAAVKEEERRLNREIEELGDQRRALRDRIAALKVQLDFITAIGREAPKTANEELIRGKLDPESWKQAWTSLGGGAAEAYEGIRGAEIEQRRLDRSIARKKRELNQIRTGRKNSVTAQVNVALSAPTRLRLELSYQLPDASWRPLYDARLDSETAKVGLTQIGEVRQRTGEDWSEVQLTLSTARPAASARMPDLESWFIDFAQVMPLENYRSRGVLSKAEKAQEGLRALGDQVMEMEAAPEPMVAQAPAPVAEVVVGEFASEYRIAGAANVPADNAPHKFVIDERSFGAALAVRVVPKVARLAYLYAEIELPAGEPLLPGPVSVFRDGAFIGTGGLGLLRPGEKHKFSFGIDDKVRVTYRLVE